MLLLNATYFGAGLNLENTDDVVLYHRLTRDLEKQVIGSDAASAPVERLPSPSTSWYTAASIYESPPLERQPLFSALKIQDDA